MRIRTILRWTAGGSLALLGVAALFYVRDIRGAYARIQDRSSIIHSPYGDIEFTQGGSGPPVLVIHGSGGGFDQGELIAEAVLGDDVHWVAPSRFGYLRSTFHEGATFDDQAHAYASLLDTLGIQKVAVVTMSHGGPSALLFAVLYPERVSSLTLLSAGVAASSAENQSDANRKGEMLVRVFKSDLLYWSATTLFRTQFMGLMGADDAVIASLTPAQRQLATHIINYMNPASPRAAGAAFDNTAALPNERIAAIQAPTLVVHAKDDGLQLFHNAEFAATTIPGARLLSYDRGGHLLIVTEQASIRDAVRHHINSGLTSVGPAVTRR
ncbi:MAG: alpha/beta hydrolase [Acidobacteria bacterium]|nr:alpha/beta hydrolase [Acidobacteriota bacterium]